jgi:tetratricopeptide (TPR) repeat protein
MTSWLRILLYHRYVVSAILFAVILLYYMRHGLGLILQQASMKKGDYDGALRWLRWMNLGNPSVFSVFCLHEEGLILSIAGRLEESEQCYRRALAMTQKGSSYQREHLYASLGSVLVDLGRFEEAEQSLRNAIEFGDLTGVSHCGLAELLLTKGVEPEKALGYLDQGIELARQDGNVHWELLADRAWALALLGRRDEARESIALSLRQPETLAPGTAGRHWRVGMALLAMQQTVEACQHFQLGKDADPRGKYGKRCAEMLRKSQ